MPRRYRKKIYKKRGNRGVAATANKALAIAKKTQKRTEIKYFDVLENTTSISFNPLSPTPLVPVPQGDQPNNRDGNVFYVTSLDIRLVFRMSATENVRMIIYSWASGTSSAATDVFSSTGTANSYLCHKTWNTRYRSNILLDKTISVRTQLPSDDLEIPFHFRLKNMNHRVSLTAGGIGAETGMIYIVFMSNQSGATPVFVQWRSRAIFKDL